MNLEGLPQTPLLTSDGQMSDEWYKFFTINAQNMEIFFNQSGHLVPRRTSAQISALGGNQTLGGSLYNPETKNEMTNVDGTYKNNTQNSIVNSANPLPAAEAGRVELLSNELNNVFINANGLNKQIPANDPTFPLNFNTSDGATIFSMLNGVNSQIPTNKPAYPMSFDSSDGSNLFVTFNGVTKQVTLT